MRQFRTVPDTDSFSLGLFRLELIVSENDLVKIGEETGDVPGALGNLADTYESELTVALRVMTNLIEPALIVVMALGVGFLLLSVLSAMFAIVGNVSR